MRGHRALGGMPSITRLNEEHSRAAPPALFDQLVSYAGYEIGRRTLSAAGSFRMFNREACVDTRLGNREVTFVGNLEGLEARVDGQSIALLRDYRSYAHMSWVQQQNLP